MIKLTKLNGEEFILNAELIQFVEQRPDTYITLTNSERFIVKEPMTEVIKRSLSYRRVLHQLDAAG